MNKNLFWIIFIFIPITAFSQNYIKVKTQYNKAEKWHELTVEIANKCDVEIGILNIVTDRYISYFEVYFYDKDGQQIPVSYIPPMFGVPFMNALDTGKSLLLLKPGTPLIFKYSKEYLFRLCKEPDRIEKMKLKFHIEYVVAKNDSIVKKDVYEQFSKTFSVQ